MPRTSPTPWQLLPWLKAEASCMPLTYIWAKIAIGPGYPEGLIDLDVSPKENLAALAKAKGCKVSDLTACVLDRSRHAKIIEDIRSVGAAIRLIGDGDVAGVIHTTDPEGNRYRYLFRHRWRSRRSTGSRSIAVYRRPNAGTPDS